MRDAKSDLTAPPGVQRPSRSVRALVALIGLYQRTAAFRAPRCRFHPTCSAYAVESLEVHGAVRGTVAAVRRILRCHPWNPGGVDPVEPRS